MKPANALNRLVWPLAAFLAVIVPGWPWLMENRQQAADITHKVLFYGVGVAIGLTLAWLLVRLIEVGFWRVLEKRLSRPIPLLLKDLVAATIFGVAGITIVALVFQKSVAGLWATSGVVGLVVGFALRNMIADVFSGIAINIDQPFAIGQWVELYPRGMQSLRGRVNEISWRCTRIRTTNNTIVVVPNSLIATTVLINLSEPQTRSRFKLTFHLDFSVPSERALRVLLAGAKAAEGLLTEPSPKVTINRVAEDSVEYTVRYWIEPAVISPREARHVVTTSILDHLHHAGITLAHPKRDLYLTRMPSRQLDRVRDRGALVSRVELFSALEPAEIGELAGRLKECRFGDGEAIVRQGDSGDSMYILVEGLLEVRKNGEDQNSQIRVNTIRPGEFFGEMSLLTGEPRAATVVAVTEAIVYEIAKADLSPLLASRPEIALEISRVVARRREQLQARLPDVTEEAPVSEHTFAEQLLERIKTFFGQLRDGWTFGRR